MAIAVAQQVVSGASLTAASATTITATITPTAGSKLFVFVRSGNTSATVTCADPTNGSYSSIDVRNLLTNMRGATFYKDGVAGSAVTITATFSAGATDRGMIVLEITGGTTGAPDTWLSASVVGSGTGTDALTTGNMTPTGQPALVLGVYSDFGGVTISAGTGFTGGTVRWNASGDSTLPEWLRITSTTALAATWTPSGSTNGIMMGAIFREASTGFTGTGSAAMSPFAASASGAETFTGTGSAALKSFAASGAGAETFTGTGSAAVQPFAVSGTGTVTAILGTGSAALSPFAAAGAGAETFTGSGSAAAAPFGVSGAGAETFTGSGSAALRSFGVSGAGTETFTGTSSAALSPFGVSGAGSVGGAVGTGSAALKSFGASGSGTVTFNFTGTGSAALKSFGASGSGFTGAPEPPLTPPLTTMVDPVVLATWVDSVVLTAPVDPVRLSLGERLKTRKTTDTYPITNTLVNNGVPVPLAGYTVTINIVSQDRTTVKRANGACTIIDAPNGRVSYQVVAGDVDTAGSYLVEWKAVSGTGVPYHFPQDGYEPLEIQPSLG